MQEERLDRPTQGFSNGSIDGILDQTHGYSSGSHRRHSQWQRNGSALTFVGSPRCSTLISSWQLIVKPLRASEFTVGSGKVAIEAHGALDVRILAGAAIYDM